MRILPCSGTFQNVWNVWRLKSVTLHTLSLSSAVRSTWNTITLTKVAKLWQKLWKSLLLRKKLKIISYCVDAISFHSLYQIPAYFPLNSISRHSLANSNFIHHHSPHRIQWPFLPRCIKKISCWTWSLNSIFVIVQSTFQDSTIFLK